MLLNLLKRVDAALVRMESALLVALLSFMVGMAFTQVAARQLFHTGILWGDTLLRHLVLWVGFLGAALATVDEKHFAWDTVVGLLNGRAKAAMLFFAHTAAGVITFLLIKASWVYLLDEKSGGKPLFSISEHPIPEWWFAVIIPVGFSLILIHLAVKAAHELAEVAGGRPTE